MTSGRAALVGLIRQYLSGLLDPFVTLLEVHKLMYFAGGRRDGRGPHPRRFTFADALASDLLVLGSGMAAGAPSCPERSRRVPPLYNARANPKTSSAASGSPRYCRSRMRLAR